MQFLMLYGYLLTGPLFYLPVSPSLSLQKPTALLRIWVLSLSMDKACLLPARPLHCSGDQRPADIPSSRRLVLASQQKEGGNRHRRHLEVLCEAAISSLTELVR